MTAKEHLKRCQALSGGVTLSETSIIQDLALMEKLAVGGEDDEGSTRWYYRDAYEAENRAHAITEAKRQKLEDIIRSTEE